MKDFLAWCVANIPAWVLIAIVAHGVVLLTVAYLILAERKIASWVQDRIGPNRVGLGFGIIPIIKNWSCKGLGQPLADGLKFLVKEDYRPGGVDKSLFTLAPGIMITLVIISIAVLPLGGRRQAQRTMFVPALPQQRFRSRAAELGYVSAYAQSQLGGFRTVVGQAVRVAPQQYRITYQYDFQIANLNIGVLFILAVLSLGVYGVVIGGWASNNKFSFLGGLRATVNMISYEIPLGLSVLCIVLMFGTLDLSQIVEKQCHYWGGVIPAWNVFSQPLAFVMFLICIHAEANRAPFDLAEAEQELVGGYHTEYSAMRFALFFLSEYAGMITTSAVCVALFFGGWHLPWLEWLWKPLAGNVDSAQPALTTSLLACIVRAIIFFAKTLGIIFVFMWVRWSLPRFRFDQLLLLAWRAMIPIALALLMVTAIVVYYFNGEMFSGRSALMLLAANILTAVAALALSTVLPPPPATNRRMTVLGSRFAKTPLPVETN